MNDLSVVSTDMYGGDDISSPPTDGGGILVTIDHVLGSVPGILDAWRRPVTIQRTGTTMTVTPVSQTVTSQGTLLMVVLIAGLIWAVS
jgi:hypothetical protein